MKQWLVGITDGDGIFHFSEHLPGKWVFYFKISQSPYNLRLLHYIKSQLGIGAVRVTKESHKNNLAEYRVRDRQLLLQHIIPIFDQYWLLTSKYYNYELFKGALLVSTNAALSTAQKQAMLTELKAKLRPLDYVSPAWLMVKNAVTSISDANQVMTKSWLVGFTEAEGRFHLLNKQAIDKDKKQVKIVHAFEMTQKRDQIVIEAAAQLLGIKVRIKKTDFTAYADSLRDIPNIIHFYHHTMKGMKSLEYRIWARSFNKMKIGNKRSLYLVKVQDQMRNIRSIRLDTAFKVVHR